MLLSELQKYFWFLFIITDVQKVKKMLLFLGVFSLQNRKTHLFGVKIYRKTHLFGGKIYRKTHLAIKKVIKRAYVLSNEQQVYTEKGITYMPIYYVMFFQIESNVVEQFLD